MMQAYIYFIIKIAINTHTSTYNRCIHVLRSLQFLILLFLPRSAKVSLHPLPYFSVFNITTTTIFIFSTEYVFVTTNHIMESIDTTLTVKVYNCVTCNRILRIIIIIILHILGVSVYICIHFQNSIKYIGNVLLPSFQKVDVYITHNSEVIVAPSQTYPVSY